MRKLLPAAVISIALIMCSCGQTSAEGSIDQAASKNPIGVKNSVVYDELYSKSEDNVTFGILRCGDDYLTTCADDVRTYWIPLYGKVPGEINLADGEFGEVTADILRMSGGEAGFSGNIDIKKLKGFTALTLEEAAEKFGLTEYDPDADIVYNTPQLCNVYGDEYCMIDLRGKIHVYLDGKEYGVYDNLIAAEYEMGLRNIPDKTVEMEHEHGLTLYVFRCGDVYLAYTDSIFMNPYWTPLMNADFRNRPVGFTLEDGEAAIVKNSDIIKLNGGEAGYDNTPMMRKAGEVEKCRYHAILMHISEGHWEESIPDKEGEMREYHCGEYLIFYIGGKFHVYHDDYEEGKQSLTGVYDTAEEVDELFGIRRTQ